MPWKRTIRQPALVLAEPVEERSEECPQKEGILAAGGADYSIVWSARGLPITRLA